MAGCILQKLFADEKYCNQETKKFEKQKLSLDRTMKNEMPKTTVSSIS